MGKGMSASIPWGPLSGVIIGRLSGVGALWDCVPHVCGGGGGSANGGVPLGDVPVLSWCGEVALGGKQSSSSHTHCVRVRMCIDRKAGKRVNPSWII